MPGFAEAPARHIVELARAEVNGNPSATRELRQFAGIRLADAETGVHNVLKQHGYSCTVKIEYADLGGDEFKTFPFIYLSSWLAYLGIRRISRQMVGTSSLAKMKQVLQEFWRRFRSVNPGHEVFELADSGQLQLNYTIPYFSHSDEGRTYKKEALWIFSVHGCLGRGTSHYLQRNKHLARFHRNEFGLNFVGQTWGTQLLIATMLREMSNENPEAMQTLLSLFASDAARLAREGLDVGGIHLWFLHVGTKGDLPALGKLGSFKRTFSHCPRAPRSKKACGGICHRCLGGQEESIPHGMEPFPYEDFSSNPGWERTQDQVEPWDHIPKVMTGMPTNPMQRSQFFFFDVWHMFHLGIAKHYLASCLVVVVESLMPELQEHRSVEAKFDWISQQYRQFCKDRRLSMWVKDLSRDSLQWPQGSTCPIGKWNKGSASTAIMLFLGFFCDRYDLKSSDDEMLRLIVARLQTYVFHRSFPWRLSTAVLVCDIWFWWNILRWACYFVACHWHWSGWGYWSIEFGIFIPLQLWILANVLEREACCWMFSFLPSLVPTAGLLSIEC